MIMAPSVTSDALMKISPAPGGSAENGLRTVIGAMNSPADR